MTAQAQLARDMFTDPSRITDERKTKVRTFVKSILVRICRVDLIEDFLTPRNLIKWNIALTHKSYSATNYELYEKVGDATLKDAFNKYLRKAVPSMTTEQEYSEAAEYYLSKTYFSYLGYVEHMDLLVLVAPELGSQLTPSIVEDVFEAFNGALSEMGDDVGEARLGYPIGNTLVKNYLTVIFNSIDFDPTNVNGSAKSRFTVRMSKYNIVPISAVITDKGKQRQSYKYVKRSLLPQEVVVPPDRVQAMRNLARFKKTIREHPDEYVVLGVGLADSAKDADELASQDALVFLDNIGWTDAAAEEAKRQREETSIEGYRELADAVRQKYGPFRITTQDVTDFRKYYTLVAQIPGGRAEYQIAYMMPDSDQHVNEVKFALLQAALRARRNGPAA